MRKFLVNILIFVYIGIAIFTTICLLSFNEFRVTEFGNYSLIIVDSDGLKPDYDKGSLVITERTSEIQNGDKIFYYNASSKENVINLAEVAGKIITNGAETKYQLTNNYSVSSGYVAGKASDVKVIPYVGTALSILESKWGFMFLVIFPTLFAFIYEIYAIIIEIKNQKA